MTPPRKHSASDPYRDQEKLHAIELMLCARAEELFSSLGISLYRSRKLYYGCCPIHGGGNASGMNFYPEGDSKPGFWRCNTKKCHRYFVQTAIGFVHGVFSHQKCGWENRGTEAETRAQQRANWRETVDWCCRFIGQDITKIRVDHAELEKRKFAAEVAQFTRSPGKTPDGKTLTRELVRKHLVIPSPYFLARGFSHEVLDRYDVGDYPAAGKPLSGRAVIPVYDNDHKFVVGFTGRSVHPVCLSCDRHHAFGACPEKGSGEWSRSSKWYNHELNKESYLFNYWFAHKHIKETGTAVLVEGQGEVIRLAEAGVEVALGMFGVDLSDEQQVLLECSGALNLVVLTNNDDAGNAAREQLKQRLRRSFRLHFPKFPGNDLGEMSVSRLKDAVVPEIEAVIKKGY